MNNLRVLTVERGEGHTGRVRNRWGQIGCSLPFAVFLTCISF